MFKLSLILEGNSNDNLKKYMDRIYSRGAIKQNKAQLSCIKTPGRR